MNPLINLVKNNPHTSGSGIAFAALKVLARMGIVWFPTHKDQIEATADALEGFCFVYFAVAAGDAAKGLSKDEAEDLKASVASAIKSGDTTVLTKPKEP